MKSPKCLERHLVSILRRMAPRNVVLILLIVIVMMFAFLTTCNSSSALLLFSNVTHISVAAIITTLQKTLHVENSVHYS